MVEVNEREVYNILLKYKGRGKVNIQGTEVDIALNPVDIHEVDSPDCLLWIEVSLRVFGQDLQLRIPIPVEAEKGGIYGGALEDLKKFVERRKYPIEVPMLVIAEAGYDSKEQIEAFPVRFSLSQSPIRLLQSK
jgi:hypothetical protein